jgi:hypothetical protein
MRQRFVVVKTDRRNFFRQLVPVSLFAGITRGLAIDRAGNLYCSVWLANRVWKIDKHTKAVTTVAGNGLPKHPNYPIM